MSGGNKDENYRNVIEGRGVLKVIGSSIMDKSIDSLCIQLLIEDDNVYFLVYSSLSIAMPDVSCRRLACVESIEEKSGSHVFYIVCERNGVRLSRHLERAGKFESPVLVVTENPGDFVFGRRIFPYDIVAIDMVSPSLIRMIVSSSIRDYANNIKLRKLAHFDPLTKVANRHLFFDRLQQIMKNSKRNMQPFSLAYFDLDFFKQVNDSHGHEFGDRYLRKFCSIVKGEIRSVDTLGRLGGDEFSLILDNTDIESSRVIMEKILKKLMINYVIHDVTTSLPASIGVVAFSAVASFENLKIKELMALADKAVYESKSNGRNTITYRNL